RQARLHRRRERRLHAAHDPQVHGPPGCEPVPRDLRGPLLASPAPRLPLRGRGASPPGAVLCLRDAVGAEAAAVAARPVAAAVDERAPAGRAGAAAEALPAELPERVLETGGGVRGDSRQALAFFRPGANAPVAVGALELRRCAVLARELVQELCGLVLVLCVEDAVEADSQRPH